VEVQLQVFLREQFSNKNLSCHGSV